MGILDNLDVRTAYLIAGMGAWCAALALFVLRDLHKPSRVAALLMGCALALGGTSTSLLAQTTDVEKSNALFAALALSSASVALIHQSIGRLFGANTHSGVMVVLVGLVLGYLAVAPISQTSVLLYFVFQTGCALATLYVLLRSPEQESGLGRYCLAGGFAVFSVATIARLVDGLQAPANTSVSSLLHLGGSQEVAVLFIAVSPPVLAILTLAILNSRQMTELNAAASTDELTGLASRRFLMANANGFRQAWTRHTANGCALLMIDVDQFKSINDRFGHETGDRVLQHVARVLNGNLRSDTILARYGGEEFCALVPIRRPIEAEAAAERLRQSVELQVYRDGVVQIQVTVSVGVALHGEASELREFLSVADRRVYKAKDMGRNRVVAEDFDSDLAIA